jgi:hypothetical protein
VRVRHIDPIDRHQDKTERIAKALIPFRRTCVDSCCQEWGGLYKQIKADFMTLSHEQSGKISQLVNETEVIGNDINFLQSFALQTASSAPICSAERWNSNAALRRSRQINPQVREAHPRQNRRRPGGGNARLREMRQNHTGEIAQKRRHVIAFLREELVRRVQPFVAPRDDSSRLEMEIPNLRDGMFGWLRRETNFPRLHNG